MPNLITHIWFGEEVLKRLPSDVLEKVTPYKQAFILGNLGPDFLYALRELGFSTRSYPNELHHNKQHKTFEAIAKYLRENENPDAYAYALGMICHYVADKNIHPYVNALCEGFVSVELGGEAMATAHGFIESAIDTYLLTERMGYVNPNDFRTEKAMRSKRSTRKAIGRMFMECLDDLHGYKLTEGKASLSFELTRAFMWAANDPNGRRHGIVRKLEKTLMGGSMAVTALMRPPVKYGEIDYLNFAHRPYRAIRNLEGSVNYDAIEVLDVALEESINTYVPALYDAIEKGTSLDVNDFLINYEGVLAGN